MYHSRVGLCQLVIHQRRQVVYSRRAAIQSCIHDSLVHALRQGDDKQRAHCYDGEAGHQEDSAGSATDSARADARHPQERD